MTTAEVRLTERARKALRAIARRTGKTQDDLVREAVEQLIAQYAKNDRQALLRQAQGIWRDRTDLPDFEALRREWDRFQAQDQ